MEGGVRRAHFKMSRCTAKGYGIEGSTATDAMRGWPGQGALPPPPAGPPEFFRGVTRRFDRAFPCRYDPGVADPGYGRKGVDRGKSHAQPG